MAHAPGCSPSDYVIPAPPQGYEWRALADVQVGDHDQFDREVTDVVRVGTTRVRIACAASDRAEATLPVKKMTALSLTSRGLYRRRLIALADLVALVKAEILVDIAEGVVPADVTTFGALHDYVDANEYGGMCDPASNANVPTDMLIDMQEAVEQWLQAGRPADADAEIPAETVLSDLQTLVAQRHAGFPQYAGHWTGWGLARVLRGDPYLRLADGEFVLYTTRSATVLDHAEPVVTVHATRRGDLGLNTVIPQAWVEIVLPETA